MIKPDPASGGVTITGSGSPTRPYLIGLASDGDIRSQIGVSDTPTLNLEMGAPDSNGKSTIYGYATQRMTDLADVADLEGPQEGDVPVWTNGHWEFKPQGTVNPGAISVSNGIGGDGSIADPLKALTSGTWPLPLFTPGTQQDTGQPVYIDSTGLLRTRPQVMRGPKPATDLPATYPYGMTVMGVGSADAATWPPGSSCIVVTYSREDTTAVAQWCYFNSLIAPKVWYRLGNTSWGPWLLVAFDTGWIDGGSGTSVCVGDATNFTVTNSQVRQVGNQVFVSIAGTMKVAITPNTAGDISNFNIAQMASAYRPTGAPNQGLTTLNSGRLVSAYIQASGQIAIGAIGGSTNLAIGEVISIGGSYLI